MSDQELERMFEQTDKLLVPYRNGIAEGQQIERERIIRGIWDLEVPLLTKGATKRDLEAMHYAIRLLKYAAVEMIKGETK
jgi:hypothetical protein